MSPFAPRKGVLSRSERRLYAAISCQEEPMELFEDAKGDPRNAQALAVACDLAYFSEAEGAPQFQQELGLNAKLISEGNTQVFVATSDDHIVVAFRGTESPNSIEG